MWFFDEKELLLAHYKLIERFGGSHGIRNLERIKSVLSAPKQEVFGQEQHTDLWQKAAVYARNIIGDHPFIDGNKRTGITCALIFLQKNGRNLKVEKGEIENFAVKIATEHLNVEEIAAWLKKHSKQS